MAGTWTAGRSAQICTRLDGRRFFSERREGQSRRSRIWNSRGWRRGRLWPMMPRPRICGQPMPWSLALSRCRPSTASRADLSTGVLVTASGSALVTVPSWKRRRFACVRVSGLVSRSARSRRHGTSPCSKQAAQRGKRTCASPGTACPASLIGSKRRTGRCHRSVSGSSWPWPGSVSTRTDQAPASIRLDGRTRRPARSGA